MIELNCHCTAYVGLQIAAFEAPVHVDLLEALEREKVSLSKQEGMDTWDASTVFYQHAKVTMT